MSQPQQLQAEYNAFKTQLQRLSSKIGELETESQEHKLVLDTLKPVDQNRRCLRLIGGVLVDKTVKDVVPALEQTQEGLNKAIKTLTEDFKTTESKLDEWKKKHNVKVVSQ